MIFFIEGGERRTRSGSPEPAAVRRVQALLLPLEIQRVPGKNLVALLLHLAQLLLDGQIPSDHFAQNIVRRRKRDNTSVIPDHTVTVTRADVKFPCIILQFIGDSLQENRRILRADLIRTVIDHPALLVRDPLLVRDRHKVAAKRDIRHRHRNADAQRLEGRPPRIIFLRVISHHRQVCGIRPRIHPLRNRRHHTDLRLLRVSVKHRRLRGLKRRLASERLDRLIGHTVSQHQ